MQGTISASSITNWPGRYESGCGYDEDDDITYEATLKTVITSNGGEANCLDVNDGLCEIDVYFYDDCNERYIVAKFALDVGMRPVEHIVIIDILASGSNEVVASNTLKMDPWHVCNLDELFDLIEPSVFR